MREYGASAIVLSLANEWFRSAGSMVLHGVLQQKRFFTVSIADMSMGMEVSGRMQTRFWNADDSAFAVVCDRVMWRIYV